MVNKKMKRIDESGYTYKLDYSGHKIEWVRIASLNMDFFRNIMLRQKIKL